MQRSPMMYSMQLAKTHMHANDDKNTPARPPMACGFLKMVSKCVHLARNVGVVGVEHPDLVEKAA